MNFSFLRTKSEQSAVLTASSGEAARQLGILKAAKPQHGPWTGIFANDHALFCGCRLYVLLSGVPDLAAKAVELSSLNTTSERSAALAAFNSGEAKLLVASDAMTRGMDLPLVAAVVNYDAPVYPKTYVHRAGRTARAGRAGGPFALTSNLLSSVPWMARLGCVATTDSCCQL